MSAVADVVSLLLLGAGALLCLTAGLGLVRFPDVLARMHAATKPQTLGVLLVMGGAAIRLDGLTETWMLLLVAVFQLFTAPVSAHLISRVAHRRRHVRRDLLVVDEVGAAGWPPRGEGPQGDQPADAST